VLGRLDDVEQQGDTYLTRDPAGNGIVLQAPEQHEDAPIAEGA
jgi:hypothetical protein